MSRFVVVGSRAGELDALALQALKGVGIVYGPERSRRAAGCVAFKAWPERFASVFAELDEIAASGGPPAGVIASGDPMHFGIGGTLVRRYGSDAVRVVPAPSAFSRAAARLGWPLEQVACVSLHGTSETGRGVESIRQVVCPRRRVLVLSRDGGTPREIARLLTREGFGRSTLTVLEEMDHEGERVRSAPADAFDMIDVAALNVVAIECADRLEASWQPLVGGLADEAFANDGQLTKSDIRALTVARLRPRPGGVMWDVGAGCGSVGIEWLRLSPAGSVCAIERSPARCELVRQNAASFGLSGIAVIEGEAPDALEGLSRPDVIFLGGGISDLAVFDSSWAALGGGGTLVANVVTLEGEAMVGQLHARHGGRLVRVAIAEAEAIGPYRGWRAAMPLTMWTVEKPA